MFEDTGHYDGFVAETYDFVIPYRERKDIDFFVETAKSADGPVLELGCGTGRVLLPIAKSGVTIAGLDISKEMLTICRKKMDQEPEEVRSRVTLVHGDMRYFEMNNRFAMAIIPFRGFHHLLYTYEHLLCLKTISRHLLPDGRLVLDLFFPFLPYLYDKRFLTVYDEEPPFTLEDGSQVVRRSKLLDRSIVTQMIQLAFYYERIYPDGRIEHHKHEFIMRYFFRYELEHVLARGGFQIIEMYSDYQKTPFECDYPNEMIVIARKKPLFPATNSP